MGTSPEKGTVLVAVFAHPDDEAFMFSGTISLYLNKGIPVYLICAMTDSDGRDIRRKEMHASAKKLGVTGLHILGYSDGSIGHHAYHQISNDIKSKILEVSRLHPEAPLRILTIEPRGVSGHIDHCFISSVTAHVFYQLPQCKKLMYFCKSIDQKPSRNPDYFVYSPPGYPLDQIHESYDITSVWDKKKAAILCHTSQIIDQYAQIDSRPLSYFNPEHFIVLEQDYKGQKIN
ncbi:MAG: PIG-L deacetylase family protein [Candidatus Roizmanbacteria bacterium]